MRVVKKMDDQNQPKIEGNENRNTEDDQQVQIKPARKFIRITPFTFFMLMVLTILLTAGLTIFALTFGEKKVVEVPSALEREEFSKLYDAFDELKENYYVEIDEEEVISGAIDGMFEALGDPYSDYMNEEEAKQFNSDLSSSFQGIGAEIQARDGNIVVVSPIKNSPAEKAGILPEDIILEVDDESIQGMSASEAVLLIRGKKGTPVTLTIQRGETSDLIEMTIVRDDIPIETVYGEMGKDKVAHIQITSFSEQTYNELVKLLNEYEDSGMKSIVLDVRQNPGGYLNSAIDISNLFVAEGKPIVQVQGREGKAEVMLATDGKKFDLPVVVLIDNGSASASEILAAALSESYNAKLVGLTSFGKGTVQTLSNMSDKSNIKYTNGKWLTPNGNWINEKGIEPDVEVEYPEYATLTYVNPELEFTIGSVSAQINSAEEILNVLGYDIDQIDETFDENTKNALLQFQADNDLKQTGVLGGETTYELMDAIREKIEKEDPHLLEAKELLTGTSN